MEDIPWAAFCYTIKKKMLFVADLKLVPQKALSRRVVEKQTVYFLTKADSSKGICG